MKKNINTIILFVILILCMIFGLYLLNKDDEKVYHKTFDSILEIGDINKYFSDNARVFNRTFANYLVESENLSELDMFTDDNKILFTLESMMLDEDQKSLFMVKDKNTLKEVSKDPDELDVISNIKIEDFNPVYKTIFNEEINDKKYISYINNKSDKYFVTSVTANKAEIDNDWVITAHVYLSLNDKLQKKLNVKELEGDIKYTYLAEDQITFISFKLK